MRKSLLVKQVEGLESDVEGLQEDLYHANVAKSTANDERDLARTRLAYALLLVRCAAHNLTTKVFGGRAVEPIEIDDHNKLAFRTADDLATMEIDLLNGKMIVRDAEANSGVHPVTVSFDADGRLDLEEVYAIHGLLGRVVVSRTLNLGPAESVYLTALPAPVNDATVTRLDKAAADDDKPYTA